MAVLEWWKVLVVYNELAESSELHWKRWRQHRLTLPWRNYLITILLWKTLEKVFTRNKKNINNRASLIFHVVKCVMYGLANHQGESKAWKNSWRLYFLTSLGTILYAIQVLGVPEETQNKCTNTEAWHHHATSHHSKINSYHAVFWAQYLFYVYLDTMSIFLYNW